MFYFTVQLFEEVDCKDDADERVWKLVEETQSQSNLQETQPVQRFTIPKTLYTIAQFTGGKKLNEEW